MHQLRGRLPQATVVLIVLIGSAFLLVQARHLWFLGDDWDFLLGRDLSENPVTDLMRPHNEHWSALPVIAFRVMFTVFGLDHYLAFAMMPIVAHAVVCVLFFVLLRRCGITPWTAVAATAVLTFLGAGSENMLWDFQVGMLGSAAFGLAALLTSVGEGRRAVALTWLFVVLSMMSSGTAIPMLVWLGGFVLLRDTLRSAVLLTGPPAGVYAVWYLIWGQHNVAYIAPTPPADVVPLAWAGLSATWSNMTGIEGIGATVLVLLFATALVVPSERRVRALALAGCVSALGAFVLFAYSRGSMGLEQVSSSRYQYFGALLTLPAFAALLDAMVTRLPPRRAERAITVFAVAVALVVPGVFGIVTTREGRAPWTDGLEHKVVAAAGLARSGETLLGSQVDPGVNPQIKIEAIIEPDVLARLPAIKVTPAETLAARTSLQVGASPESWDLPMAPASVSLTESTPSGDCLIGLGAPGSYVEVPSGEEGAQFRLTISGTDRTVVRLRDGRVTSLPMPLVVGDTTEVYVGVSAPGVDLLVDLPPGAPFTVCGL